MKACLLSSPRPVEASPLLYRDVPNRQPVGSEVLIRVRACGICRTDLHVVEGELPPRKSQVIPGHQVVGTIEARGDRATRFPLGTRVGVPWLHRTCGVCPYCVRSAENLCESADFTGYTVDGGYAEYTVAPDEYVYELPAGVTDVQAAPLLCAGIIGYRSLRLAGVPHGGRLGLYGFGAAGHVAIQVARHWDISVYVCTRDARHQRLAAELGAAWVGDAAADPPAKLDGAIIFAPAGELVPPALRALDKGSTLVLGGIHMSDIPAIPYELLYEERVIRSVANNTRRDGRDFLKLAAEIPIRTSVEVYPLADANRALQSLKNDVIRGAAVLTVG
ncbi:MAG: zinc-dependent alcohol dehydrogenase family protein [Bryobacteraceae bacterium]